MVVQLEPGLEETYSVDPSGIKFGMAFGNGLETYNATVESERVQRFYQLVLESGIDTMRPNASEIGMETIASVDIDVRGDRRGYHWRSGLVALEKEGGKIADLKSAAMELVKDALEPQLQGVGVFWDSTLAVGGWENGMLEVDGRDAAGWNTSGDELGEARLQLLPGRHRLELELRSGALRKTFLLDTTIRQKGSRVAIYSTGIYLQ